MAQMTLAEANRIMKEETNRELREQAQQALVQMASFETSAYYSFVSEHVGQHGLYGSGNPKGDVDNLYHDCEANKRMLFEKAKELTGEVTPQSLARAWNEIKDRLAPIPADPRKNTASRLSEEGQRTMFPPQKHEHAAARLKEQTVQTPPFTKYQLLVMAGQVKGQPADLKSFRRALAVYGSPAINRILQAD